MRDGAASEVANSGGSGSVEPARATTTPGKQTLAEASAPNEKRITYSSAQIQAAIKRSGLPETEIERMAIKVGMTSQETAQLAPARRSR